MQTIINNYRTLTEEIKERIDIADLVRDHVELKQKGNRYWGLCPFHAERTPSFSVNPEKQVFYCFGCHESGDILTFYMKINQVDFKTARDHLAYRAGIRIDTQSLNDYQRLQAANKLREREQELASKLRTIIEVETKRLIAFERWIYKVSGLIQTPEMLDVPVINWAIKHKDEVEFFIDELMQADDTRAQLAIVRLSRVVIRWEP